MNILVFFVGVRGAGKTTTLQSLEDDEDLYVLKPSTTRKRRSKDDDEYYFVDEWNSADYEWEISIGENRYGMSKNELHQTKQEHFLLTVFDPSAPAVIEQARDNYHGQILTIGLDTVDSIEVIKERTSGDSSRVLNEKEFLSQRETVQNCDVVLRGDQDVVRDAVRSIFSCLRSRGGIIQKSLIKSFLLAEILLENTTDTISPASYDLRLGDDVWCQGVFSHLDEYNPVLKIPAYSYAIVSAKEVANLPSFISARFDLKNSLFFRGVILSNGPQVDPGYRGALFCMLYNGSDQAVGITRGDHFATIEFITTSGVDLGYRDKYQGKTKLKDFMPADAAVSEGGKIFEKTSERIGKLEEDWKGFRNIVFSILAIALTIVVAPPILISWNIMKSWNEIESEYIAKRYSISETEKKVKKLVKDLSKYKDISVLENKLNTIENSMVGKSEVSDLQARLRELKKEIEIISAKENSSK